MFFVVVISIILPQSIAAQRVKGKVTDTITGEALIAAAVRVVELPGTGEYTNLDGEFNFTITKPGGYTIETSYLGYETSVLKEVLVAGVKEVVLNINLRESKTELDEVISVPI